MPKRFEVRVQIQNDISNTLMSEADIANLVITGAFDRLRIVDTHGELKPVFLVREKESSESKEIRENYLKGVSNEQ